MGFFSFGRKSDLDGDYSLGDIPLFSSLTPSEQKQIQSKARLVEYKRGDIVYEEGSPSDAFYIIVSGRIRMFRNKRGDSEGETLLFLYRGQHFGEGALITAQNHTASVEAKRDSHLLILDKEDFFELLELIPAISLQLNRALGHRWLKIDDAHSKSCEVKIAALYPAVEDDRPYQFWNDFAHRLLKETHRNVLVIDFSKNGYERRGEFGEVSPLNLQDFDKITEQEFMSHIVKKEGIYHYLSVPSDTVGSEEKSLVSLLTQLTYQYEYLMIYCDRDLTALSSRVLKRTDCVYVYTKPDPSSHTKNCAVLNELKNHFSFSANEIKILMEEKANRNSLSYVEHGKLLGQKIFTVLPRQSEKPDKYNYRLGYLSRELSGSLIGLALGSGAAYGLSHIGILRTFERENIPIDVISGSSIGALIGAFWAAGFSSDELENVAKSITPRNAFNKLIGFQDLLPVYQGFIKGNRIQKFIEGYLKGMTFQDLNIPLRIIATNLFNSQEVVFDSGNVAEAIRASISIPGIFKAFPYKGDYLIDGGVIDPLPVSVLSDLGCKKTIAVNVLISFKDRRESAEKKAVEKMNRLREIAKKKGMMKGWAKQKLKNQQGKSINVLNVIMNTIQFMEYELAEFSGRESDILMHPVVEDAHWAQFYYPDKFIKAGEKCAEMHLDDIKQLVSE